MGRRQSGMDSNWLHQSFLQAFSFAFFFFFFSGLCLPVPHPPRCVCLFSPPFSFPSAEASGPALPGPGGGALGWETPGELSAGRPRSQPSAVAASVPADRAWVLEAAAS